MVSLSKEIETQQQKFALRLGLDFKSELEKRTNKRFKLDLDKQKVDYVDEKVVVKNIVIKEKTGWLSSREVIKFSFVPGKAFKKDVKGEYVITIGVKVALFIKKDKELRNHIEALVEKYKKVLNKLFNVKKVNVNIFYGNLKTNIKVA